jgi:hypothetical protein
MKGEKSWQPPDNKNKRPASNQDPSSSHYDKYGSVHDANEMLHADGYRSENRNDGQYLQRVCDNDVIVSEEILP